MKLYRSFATVGGLTLLSRVLGFVRDILIASVLGSGAIADAFFVAFRFPNLFRRLFGEGAFNSAFVPLFAKRLEGEGKDAARAFAEEAWSGLAFVLTFLSIALMLAMPWLMALIAPGFVATPAKYDLAVTLTTIAFPYLLCMSLVALLSGVLNSLGRFAESAAVSIVLNLTLTAAILIAMMLGYHNEPAAGVVLAWGVFFAGIFQLIVLMYGVYRQDMWLRWRRPRWSDDMKRLVHLGVPGVIAGGVTQINILIGTMIASMQNGAVSHLYYADRVYELPLAIVGIAIGVVLLPDISRHVRSGDQAALLSSQNRSLEFALALTLPASVALAIIPYEIVSILFERGAYTAKDTPFTAAALAIFAFGLPGFVLIKVFSPAFFAREDTKTPMRYAVLSLTLNTIGSVVLFFVFRSMHIMPHLGIALATTLGGWLNAGLLWRAGRKMGYFSMDAQMRRSLPRLFLASLIMGGFLWGAAHLLSDFLSVDAGIVLRALALGAIILSAMVVYGVALAVFGVLPKFSRRNKPIL